MFLLYSMWAEFPTAVIHIVDTVDRTARAKMFNEEQQKFLVDRAEESLRLMDQLMGENYRNVSGTEFLEVGGLGGSAKWPKFSDRFQELRKKQIDLENEVVAYIQRIFSLIAQWLRVQIVWTRVQKPWIKYISGAVYERCEEWRSPFLLCILIKEGSRPTPF